MKNTIFINNIIRAVFILVVLIFALISNEQFYVRLAILSFIVLLLCNVGKNICNLLNKTKLANLFHKVFIALFIIFAIAFIILWSYSVVKSNEGYSLLFTIPFWIFIIYIIIKNFIIKNRNQHCKYESKIKMIGSSLLVSSVLLLGIILLTMGIKDTINTNNKTKDYILTSAYFSDYEKYDEDDFDDNTYRLIFVYRVNNIEYQIKTDYGSGTLPESNSERKIKYNPHNPSEAIFLGTNKNNLLIYAGIFFIMGGMVFVLGYLYILGVFDKIKINVLGIYIGLVFVIMGIGIFAILFGESLSFTTVVKQMKLWTLMPLIFIVVGSLQIIKCLFLEDKKGTHQKTKKSSK